MNTTSVLGPDTPESSISNTFKSPSPHQKGQAGIDTQDIKAAMVPAKPYVKRKKTK